MQLVHITFASRTRHSLFPSTALQRHALHALARVVGPRLVLFYIVDDHVHVVLFVEPGTGARVAGHITRACRISTRAARYRGRIDVPEDTCWATLRQLRLMHIAPGAAQPQPPASP
jgi:hypothetical protein